MAPGSTVIVRINITLRCASLFCGLLRHSCFLAGLLSPSGYLMMQYCLQSPPCFLVLLPFAPPQLCQGQPWAGRTMGWR